MTGLNGAYVYGDYGSGKIWALRFDGLNLLANMLLVIPLIVASFGLDADNELYFTFSRFFRDHPADDSIHQKRQSHF